MKETFKPAKELQGTELALYKLYRYAAVKTPATEDPRLSLRPLFFSKVGVRFFCAFIRACAFGRVRR